MATTAGATIFCLGSRKLHLRAQITLACIAASQASQLTHALPCSTCTQERERKVEGGGAGDPPHAQDRPARAGEREERHKQHPCHSRVLPLALPALPAGALMHPADCGPRRMCIMPVAAQAARNVEHACLCRMPWLVQVGTTSVEKSEIVAGMLEQEGIPYQVGHKLIMSGAPLQILGCMPVCPRGASQVSSHAPIACDHQLHASAEHVCFTSMLYTSAPSCCPACAAAERQARERGARVRDCGSGEPRTRAHLPCIFSATTSWVANCVRPLHPLLASTFSPAASCHPARSLAAAAR